MKYNSQPSQGFRPLFGNQFLSIQRFFAKFKCYKNNNDEDEGSPLIVLMGTPSAAFRVISSSNTNITNKNPGSTNGQANLPLLNFTALDFRRNYGMENPYAQIVNRNSIWTSDIDKKERIGVSRSSQTWTINFQASLWTNGYKERDDLMSKILTTFSHEVGIKWYHDPIQDPNNWTWIVLRMEESFTDDTNIEDLSEKDSRKIIRSSFSFYCQTELPYDIEERYTIKSIQTSFLNSNEKILESNLKWDCIDIDNEQHLVVFRENGPFFDVPTGF